MILQRGPNMGPPFPKLFAKNLVFGRSFPAEPCFSGNATGWSAGASGGGLREAGYPNAPQSKMLGGKNPRF